MMPTTKNIFSNSTDQPKLKILPVLILWFFCISCADEPSDRRPIPDIDPEKVDIVRFDQLLCHSIGTSDTQNINQLLTKYPVFSDVFFNQVIFPQNTASIHLNNLIQNYCGSPAIRHLTDTVQYMYPNLDNLEKDLGEVFGYFRHYFPQQSIPKVFTYVSEFGIGTFTVDTRVLGIGLDFFMGKNYPYYDPAVFPKYMQETMTSEYITANAVRALAQVLIPPVTTGNFLEFMIRNGKILYLSSQLTPQIPFYQLTLYTPSQMEWVVDNELNIWSYLVDLGYFYESDQRKFKKFIDPAPTTPGMPQEAPGRVANWIGYRIVEAYMNRHPQISLRELAADTDYQAIMNKSKYKPARPS